MKESSILNNRGRARFRRHKSINGIVVAHILHAEMNLSAPSMGCDEHRYPGKQSLAK